MHEVITATFSVWFSTVKGAVVSQAMVSPLTCPLFAPSNHDELLATIGWPSLASRRKYFRAVLGHRMATSNVPQHLKDYIPSRPTHMHNTRKPPFFQLPTTNTSLMLNSPLYQAADTFNALPAILQSASNLTSFKNGAALFLLTCHF